jgi:hypothetical protein
MNHAYDKLPKAVLLWTGNLVFELELAFADVYLPSLERVTCAFDIQSNVISSCKFDNLLYMRWLSRVDCKSWVASHRASFRTGIRIARDARAIRINGRTGISGPDGTSDTSWIVIMEVGIEPSRENHLASLWVIVWLSLVANRAWWNSPNESTGNRLVEMRKLCF